MSSARSAATALRWQLLRRLGGLLIAGLSACGGGGGGGAEPNSVLSLSASRLEVSAATDQPAPAASVTATVTNMPAEGLYVGYTATSEAVTGVDFTESGPASATISIGLRSPAELGEGIYSDTVTIHVCYDEQCNSPVGNSPKVVTVVYRVTAGAGPHPATPLLLSLSPQSAVVGSQGFTLTVTGTGFVAESALQWDGATRPTSYDSPTQLTAQISSSDLSKVGSVPVTVSNASVGGGTSVALAFTVQAPAALSLTRISPTGVVVGGPGFVVTAIGTGFATTSVVQWNGTPRPTTYVSPTELTARIGAEDIARAGSAAVTVFNPGGLGKVSSSLPVSIAAPSVDSVAFQIDAGHTGAMRFKNVSLPATSRWRVDLGGAPSYALIAAGKVFVTVSLAGGSSQLVALDQATGTMAWGPIVLAGQANAAFDAGSVFVVSAAIGNAALMQAYDAADGRLKWSTLLSGQYMFSSPPTAAHGMVYTGGAGSGGTLYAVDQSSGAIVWTRPVANGDSSAPAVTSDGVYVTYPCNTYAFRPATGEQNWSDNTGCSGGGGATPVVANGVLYAPNGVGGSYSGSIFNAATGRLLGAYVADNPPAIGSEDGYFLQGGTLRGISLSTNTVQWSFAGDGRLVTSPIVVNQYVFVGASSGKLFAVDAATGSQQWVQELGAPIPAGANWGARMQISGLSAGGGLLVVPAGNGLTAFALSDAP